MSIKNLLIATVAVFITISTIQVFVIKNAMGLEKLHTFIFRLKTQHLFIKGSERKEVFTAAFTFRTPI